MPARDEDEVDRKLEIWAADIPGIDLSTEGIVSRVQFLNKRLRRSMEETLAQFDLAHAEWVVLGSLRSGGEPRQRSAGELAGVLDLSSGAMTNRLDRMEEAGLLRRLPDPDDRRGVKVEPTEKGMRLWQEAAAAQAEKEKLLAATLSRAEQEQLNGLLRRLVLAFETPSSQR